MAAQPRGETLWYPSPSLFCFLFFKTPTKEARVWVCLHVGAMQMTSWVPKNAKITHSRCCCGTLSQLIGVGYVSCRFSCNIVQGQSNLNYSDTSMMISFKNLSPYVGKKYRQMLKKLPDQSNLKANMLNIGQAAQASVCLTSETRHNSCCDEFGAMI